MALVVENLPACPGDRRDAGLIPGSGRSPGREHGHPLWYSWLGNPTDRGACQGMGGGGATVYRVAKSWTQLKRLSTHTQIPVYVVKTVCSNRE